MFIMYFEIKRICKTQVNNFHMQRTNNNKRINETHQNIAWLNVYVYE